MLASVGRMERKEVWRKEEPERLTESELQGNVAPAGNPWRPEEPRKEESIEARQAGMRASSEE
jgi:hypothetical protein